MKKTNRFSNKSINNRIKFALFIITSLAIAIASGAPGAGSGMGGGIDGILILLTK